MTSWRGYPPYGEDRAGKRVPMTSRAAVRFVVRFRSGDSTTAPRRRSFATAPEAREFFRLLRRADAAGWQADADGLPQDPDAPSALSGEPSVVEPMSEPVAAPALRGRSFTE